MTSQTMTRMLPERRHLICTMNLLCISFHTDPSRYTLSSLLVSKMKLLNISHVHIPNSPETGRNSYANTVALYVSVVKCFGYLK